jgi:hypothetical protein
MNIRQPDLTPEDDALALPAEPPQINTPVIDVQAVEHHPPEPGTHVTKKGAKITPLLDSEDTRDFAQEDEDALVALEQIEKSLRGQLPG